ncbi:subtilisin family serine protease [Actinoplanes campanulatus]|uniref:Subtilisin family serine protease n=2 Tax=Actinoplanes campanulatus TaxID=113559 RepID=A0A7W5ADZ6_9ACTN|nr:subtilisin family serine protease [Actinoplanes campanulatus]GGN20448.1 serine protease [Actinoplanes campanulatus]GID35727.1 serine protease [Actinoplanes campanulatus]
MRLRTIAGMGTLALTVTTLAAFGAPATAAEPTGAIRQANSPDAIEGSYIVVLKDGTTSTLGSRAGKLADRYDGAVEEVYAKVLKGFEARIDASDAARLAADPAVAYVEQNQIIRLAEGTQTGATWGLDRIDQESLPLSTTYTYPNTAFGVHAYIIDTGILTTHGQFGGRAVSGYDFVDSDSDATDCNGHGTHVAGTVGGSTYGVAKAVQLVGVRVLDCEGSGTTAGVISGVNWVTSNAIKPAVANMSLGGGASTSLDTAVANSIAAGITYGVAAGNDNANASTYSPARVASAITVGATTSTDARASYSNYGSSLDIFAPGSSITSAWYTSTTATNTISGTSMATPHVVGAAALVLQDNPSYTPAQVASALVANAVSGKVTSAGTGSPNLLLQVGDSGGGETPAGCTGTNGTDVAIPDAGSAVTSSITISGCGRSASSTSTVAVDITHTYRGDLVVTLVAPDGSTYTLKSSSSSDSADNVKTTYTANLSSEAADGTWQLRVQDVYSSDTGTIGSWTLTV